MAAALPAVNLQTAARFTGVPYGTLTRWACERAWLPDRREGRTLYYSWDLICDAVDARRERTHGTQAA